MPYNSFVQEHFRHPRHLGALPQATHRARTFRDDAMMEFSLRVEGARVAAASFRAIGCAGTVAAGSVLAEWLHGRSVAEARALDADGVLALLGDLPPERLYCAAFAADALHAALATPLPAE